MDHAQHLNATSPVFNQERKCPACQKVLSAFNFQGVEVDVCPAGCGTWMDTGELVQMHDKDFEQIDRAFEGTFSPKSLPEGLEKLPQRHCPVDLHNLYRYEWNLGSGIVLEQCPNCRGVWMDGGELEGVVQYVQRFRENPPELTPELKVKLEAARLKADQEFEAALDKVTRQTVRWDLGLVDDVFRGLMKGILRQS